MIAAMLLSRRAAFAHATFGYLLVATVVIGEDTKVLSVHMPEGAMLGYRVTDPRVAATILFVYGLLTAAAATLATGIARRLREGEVRLRSARVELDAVAELRRAFLHVVVHDLRSPISTVVTLVDNLESGYGGPLTDTQADWVRRAGARLRESLDLLRDLQTLADLATSQLDLLMAPVSAEAWIRTTTQDHVEMARQHDIDLRIELPQSLPSIRGIQRLLREALANYLTNAIKYTQAGGHVVVRARRLGSALRIEVEDDGPGLSAADQGCLLQESSRDTIHRARPSHVPGTALGLSIVRRIAEVHHGSAGVASESGKGSTFFLEIPVVNESHMANRGDGQGHAHHER